MSARDVIAGCLDFGGQCETCFCSDETRCEVGAADTIISALSAMPLASRLALARALVPEMAVVPREATEGMVEVGADAISVERAVTGLPPTRHRMTETDTARAVWFAMLTAAEKETPDE